MLIHRSFSLLAIGLLIVAYFTLSQANSPLLNPSDTAGKYTYPLHIYSDKHILTSFNIEPAYESETMRLGLMHRTSMPENAGMLFIFPMEQPVAMWMKNTPLSLDMLFISADGTIQQIVANTTPFSEKTIRGPHKIKYVLEINGGMSDKEGIEVGDHIEVNQILKSISQR